MKLFKYLKRLLEFSGVSINQIHNVNDGFVFDVEHEGQRIRIFGTVLKEHEHVNYEY